MEKGISFIHAADLHLDTPFQGLQSLPPKIFKRVKESTFRSFQKIIDTAIQQQVDFILISGDLYDGERRSLRAQVALRKELERLAPYKIQTFIIHGNHDHLGGEWMKITWPQHVHFFTEKVDVLPYYRNGQKLAHIYGFSYPKRAVTDNMVPYYQKIEGAHFHIGLLHGNAEGNVDHDPYVPFKKQELIEKDFDYWALGHIHKREILHHEPPIVYSGNIQGRHRKEAGEKGCYVVELNKNSSHLNFIETADIKWLNKKVEISDLSSMDELIEKCKVLKEDLRTEKQGIFLSLDMVGSGVLHTQLQHHEQVEELKEILNDEEERDNHFIWTVGMKVKTIPYWDRKQLRQDGHFISDLIQHVDSYQSIDEAISPLFNHRRAKKFLGDLTDEEKEELLKDAEQLIIDELLSEKEV